MVYCDKRMPTRLSALQRGIVEADAWRGAHLPNGVYRHVLCDVLVPGYERRRVREWGLGESATKERRRGAGPYECLWMYGKLQLDWVH
jgi:hypothetical protein